MSKHTRHFSYYINVGQIIGVAGAVLLGREYFKLAKEEAGIQERPVTEVLREKWVNAKRWINENVRFRTYQHR